MHGYRSTRAIRVPAVQKLKCSMPQVFDYFQTVVFVFGEWVVRKASRSKPNVKPL